MTQVSEGEAVQAHLSTTPETLSLKKTQIIIKGNPCKFVTHKRPKVISTAGSFNADSPSIEPLVAIRGAAGFWH